VKCKEPLGWQLLANHNIKFYLDLMKEIRKHILADTFEAFYRERRVTLVQRDEDNPPIIEVAKKSKYKPVPSLGNFSVHVGTNNVASVRHNASGEIMHSVNDPNDEAKRLYVDQSVWIADALASGEDAADRDMSPLVVWDVGLGVAHNAMALIRQIEQSVEMSPTRPGFSVSPRS